MRDIAYDVVSALYVAGIGLGRACFERRLLHSARRRMLLRNVFLTIINLGLRLPGTERLPSSAESRLIILALYTAQVQSSHAPTIHTG